MQARQPAIGFITVESSNSYTTQLLLGANDAATQLGCTLVTVAINEQMMYAKPGTGHFYAQFEKWIDLERLDGLLIWSAGLLQDHGQALHLLAPYQRLPTVSLGIDLPGIYRVIMDGYQGMFALVEHLITVAQRTNFAFITGTPTNYDAQIRLAAYRAALLKHGLPVAEAAIVPGAFRWDSRALGAQAVAELWDNRGLRPDAIVAASDDLAIGALQELQRRGLRVPDEVAVTGFDDLPETALIHPPLTTVAQPAYQLAWQGVEFLLQRLSGATDVERVRIPAHPVIRASCGTPSDGLTESMGWRRYPCQGAAAQPTQPLNCEDFAHFLTVSFQPSLEEQLAVHPLTTALSSVRDTLTAWLAALSQSILTVDPTPVVKTLYQLFEEVQQEERLSAWQQALLAHLGHCIQQVGEQHFPGTPPQSCASFCHYLAAQVRLFFAQAIQRASRQAYLVEKQQFALLHMVSRSLLIPYDAQRLAAIFRAKLPQLGITLAYIAIYDGFEQAADQARLVVAYEEDQTLTPLAVDQLYPTAALASGTLISQDRRLNLVLIPLYSTSIHAGFVLFGFGPRSYQFYTQLATTLGYSLVSSSLVTEMRNYTTQLEAHVDARTAELQQTNRQLQAEIGERKRVEAQLEIAYQQAVTSSRLKSEFLATMSHEIRTPMNGIMGMLELLLEEELNEELRSYAAVAYEESQNLLTVINSILDFSKIEAGKIILEATPFAPAAELEGVIRLLTPKAQAKGIRLLYKAEGNLPCRLIGDSIRIRQIMMNLVGNAVKFTEWGEVTVTLGCLPVPGVNGNSASMANGAPLCLLQFTVRDTGIGMNADHLKNLFQLFVQGDSSTTRRYGGTGLGLAITHRLVDLMGGKIDVGSAVGVGSQFQVTIPLPVALPEHQEFSI